VTIAAYVDIHALQAMPVSNLNRDGAGTPKMTTYGGVQRYRVSSQAWKRATRREVELILGDPAIRTRCLAQAITADLTHEGWNEDAALEAARQVLFAAGLKTDADKATTAALLYLPASSIASLAALCSAHREAIEALAKGSRTGKKDGAILPRSGVEEIFRSRNGVISLTGRMLAELPSARVDGTVQYAHSFTTHAAVIEPDYFTALDDLPGPGSEARSAHLGTTELSSGTFYRYASLAASDLHDSLRRDTKAARELAAAFLMAFAASVPSGKRNATAPSTIPALVYVAVRADRPVSLATAFEAPVPAGPDGHVLPSAAALDHYAGAVHAFWDVGGLTWHGHATTLGFTPSALGDRASSLPVLLASAVDAALPVDQ
jgi:CRISPR system Cascade subunit CasC